MIRSIRRSAVAVALLGLVGLAACGDDGAAGQSSAPAGEDEVQLVKLDFEPSSLTIDAGTEVTWTWTENLAHNVVADDGTFRSDVQPTGTFSHTFDETGTFPYTCTLHPGMDGVVIVE